MPTPTGKGSRATTECGTTTLRIERLFDEAKSTTDRNFRAENYRKIVDIVVNQDVPLIKLQSMPRFFAARDVVGGGYVSPKGYWNAKDWSWQEPSDE